MAVPPASLQLERCVQLLHATPLRKRYRLISTTTIVWLLLEKHLMEHLPGRGLGWRLNRSAQSIVICSQQDGSSAPLHQALPILIAALARAGARPPAAEVVRISLGKTNQAHRPWRLLLWPINLASLGLSLSFLSLASFLSLLGIIGLMLPLAPGVQLLILASLSVELALLLRSPFLAQPAA